MDQFMLRLILLTATVTICAAIVRYALGPAHTRAQRRVNRRGRARAASDFGDDKAAIPVGAARTASPSRQH